MFYFVSKLFFAFARPLHFLLLIMLIGLVLQLLRRRRIGLWLLNIAAIALLLASFSPLAYYLDTMLEARFPRPDVLDPAPDGIIILGGGIDVELQRERPHYVALTDAAERLTEIPRLAKLYPNARIIYTGGPDLKGTGVESEADSARDLLVQMGIPAERITLEDRSLTTWENATLTKALIDPAPTSRWLLVTSAWHMPRSVGTFRAAGWPGIIAYPTDYRMIDVKFGYHSRPLALDNLDVVELAAKEWYGLFGYWMTGRSSALFPAP